MNPNQLNNLGTNPGLKYFHQVVNSLLTLAPTDKVIGKWA